MQDQTPREMEIRACVREHDKGGLSWEQIADREGIMLSTLKWWRTQIRRRDRERMAEPGDDFVEVDLSTVVRSSTSVFEVVLLDGRSVRVPAGFDSTELRRLLAVIDGSC